jgi:hypothetical protein
MKRGLKAAAERLALKTREEIGQDAEERLDLPRLRAHLDVALARLGDLASTCPEAVQHLLGEGRASFSAALLIGPKGRLIVINESHSATRLANSIAHELSHLLLGHQPSPAFDPLGNREWPAEDEEHADWLAGCLLAPRAGLIPVMTRLHFDLGRAARHYGISPALMRQRWNQTGAAAQLRRGRRA